MQKNVHQSRTHHENLIIFVKRSVVSDYYVNIQGLSPILESQVDMKPYQNTNFASITMIMSDYNHCFILLDHYIWIN